MQHLQSFPPDLNQSRRLEVSRLFYSSSSLPSINRSKSVEFVPFLQERDQMGKLLSSTTNIFKDPSSSLSLAESRLYDQRTLKLDQVHDQKINKAVSSFFKKIDMESRQLARARFAPKKIVIISENNLKDRPSQCEYDISSGLNQIKSKIRDVLIREEKKQSSPQKMCLKQKLSDQKKMFKERKSQEIELKTLRNNSMFEKRLNQQQSKSKSQVKVDKQLFGHRKSNSLLKELKVKLNPQQPEYKRYKQQQQASLKVFEDYEQGHDKFRQKMKESKQIAYKIKKELQLD